MTTDIWGPITWTLIHILSQRVHQSALIELFDLIYSIVSFLPCPLCSDDSKSFMSKINKQGIKEPIHLQDIYFMFHNVVNKKKQKPLFKHENLVQYKYMFIIPVYQKFKQLYKTNNNIRLIHENFQRNLIKQKLNLYIRKYIKLLVYLYPKPMPISTNNKESDVESSTNNKESDVESSTNNKESDVDIEPKEYEKMNEID
jgi:hypothetical protein